MKVKRLIRTGFLCVVILMNITCTEESSWDAPPMVIQKNSPAGDELQQRINMCYERLEHGDVPQFTETFILADVSLLPQFARRFTEYSGDISGRYISSMSLADWKNPAVDLHKLVRNVIACQQADGRFGDAGIMYQKGRITKEQMPLLWGNGRLLVGLLDYYERFKKENAIASATKLGDFLVSTMNACLDKSVANLLKKEKAMGFICFTQLTEGLTKLYAATSEQKYLDAAASAYTLLPPRGRQHSHGYLNTLKGAAMVFEQTSEQKHLKFAQDRFDELVKSDDFFITGGVPEYFGQAKEETTVRDEGCSEADFVMLAFRLWNATSDIKYLEYAEGCLLNHLFFNQFDSGDFGHHYIEPDFGAVTAKNVAHAWWCCDFHGLNALLHAQQYIVTRDAEVRKINLYWSTDYTDDDIHFQLQKINGDTKFHLKIMNAPRHNVAIALRIPWWARALHLTIKDDVVAPEIGDGYATITRRWKAGEILEIAMDMKIKLHRKDGRVLTIEELDNTPITAAITYGPYLLCVDDVFSTDFMAEPSHGNLIYIPSDSIQVATHAAKQSRLPETYMTLPYVHSGMYSEHEVTLRPIAETTHQPLANVQVWLKVQKRN